MARAQTRAKVEATATATVVSDYRFRGVSLSNRKPALQGGLDLAYDGWFGGGWASTLGRGGDAGVELDLYAGRRGKLRGLRYSVAGYIYIYPDVPNARYVELQTCFERDIGRKQLALEASFAPKQNGLPFDNVYVGTRGELPLPPAGLSLVVRGGYEDGFFHRKLDWELGTKLSKGPVTFAVSIVGSSLGKRFAPRADGSTGLLLAMSGTW
jgi:uncharacterized protein (TIGR02001 family)